jgi:hypothetical protein
MQCNCNTCEAVRQFPNSFKNLFLTTNLTLNGLLLEPQFLCFYRKKSLFRAPHVTRVARSRQAFTATSSFVHGPFATFHGLKIYLHGPYYSC